MIEIEAKNIDLAIKKAEKALGLNRKYIKYEIDTEKSSLFSQKEKKIVIKAFPNEEYYDKELTPFLEEFKRRTYFRIMFKFEKKEERIKDVIIKGKDVRWFEKNDGELLIAFQYLLNKIIGEKIGAVIRVDTENSFRKRKEAKIKELIEKAERELKENEDFLTDKLNPYDRKYLHIIASEKGLATESIGEGYYKRVKIRKNVS